MWFCCTVVTFHLYNRTYCSFCITDGMAETHSWRKNQRDVKARTLSQATSRQGFFGRAEAQLPTHHGGRQQAPVVITYGAPLAVFQHLHSALTYDGPPTETDQRLLRMEMETLVKDVTANGSTTDLVFSISKMTVSWNLSLCIRRMLRQQTGWLRVYTISAVLLTVYTNWKCEINTSMVVWSDAFTSRAQTA